MSSAISIPNIDHGIVFLMAEWSGPAQWAWRHLCDFIECYPGAKPSVYKIEWDEAGPVYSLPELDGKVHGNGEAMVVRDGRIVFFTVLGKEQAEFQSRCQELLKHYES